MQTEAVQKCKNFVVLEKIMLKNAYLGAKIGFDTAANELSKVCPLSVYRSPRYVIPPSTSPAVLVPQSILQSILPQA